MKKTINFKRQLLILGILGLLLAAPITALAIGQTTDPIVIENALRGGEFQKTMIVLNNDGEKVEVKLSANGQIADWTKFYLPSDLKNPIQEFSLEKDAQANVVVVFTVPQDTANGDYSGFIGAGKKIGSVQENQNGSSVSVEQRIDRKVDIKVTDKEVLNLLISVIPETYNVKSGENLSVRFIYDNQSNVALKPQIQFRLKKDDKVVYNAIFPYPDGEEAVRPLAQKEITPLTIPTTDLPNGRYLAEIDFLHNGQSITTQNFKFSIGTGAVLGAQEINLSYLWLALLLIIILAAILVGIYFALKRVGENKKTKGRLGKNNKNKKIDSW